MNRIVICAIFTIFLGACEHEVKELEDTVIEEVSGSSVVKADGTLIEEVVDTTLEEVVDTTLEEVVDTTLEEVVIETVWVADSEYQDSNYVVRDKRVDLNGSFIGMNPLIDHYTPLLPETHNFRSFGLTTHEDYIYKRDNNLLEIDSYHSYNETRDIERYIKSSEWTTNEGISRVKYVSGYMDSTMPLFPVSWSVKLELWETDTQYALNLAYYTDDSRLGSDLPLLCTYIIIDNLDTGGNCTYYGNEYVISPDFMKELTSFLIIVKLQEGIDKAVLIQNELLKYMGVL